MSLLWKKSRQNVLKVNKYRAEFALVCVRGRRGSWWQRVVDIVADRPGKVYVWETLVYYNNTGLDILLNIYFCVTWMNTGE